MAVLDWAPLVASGAALVAAGIAAYTSKRALDRTQPHTEAVATQTAVTAMNAEIGQARESFMAEITAFRTSTVTELSGIRAGLDGVRNELSQQRTEFRGEFAELRSDVRAFGKELSQSRFESAHTRQIVEDVRHNLEGMRALLEKVASQQQH